MIPDIAIGAIAAALIGAVISLVGLIVAKESKVSEFRQSWVDALRTELSAFLSNANAAVDAQRLSFKSDTERFKTLHPFYEKLNESYYSIALRLNSKEDHSKRLKKCMVEISKFVKNSEHDFDLFESYRIDFINISNVLLKDEWRRVKAGEPVYRIARWIAAIATLVLIAAVTVAALRNPAAPTRAPAQITSAHRADPSSSGAGSTPITTNGSSALQRVDKKKAPSSEATHHR